jgi:hypothetical protein
MDALGSYLTAELIKSLGEGNITKFLAYLAIFVVLWFELRGVKKAVKNLTATISKSFADGEKRFDTLEHQVQNFEHRLTVLEQNTLGGNT